MVYHVCDITGEKIEDCAGWYGNEKVHISPKGMEILIEDWIKRNSITCGYPYILHSFILRFTKKRKLERYIPLPIRKMILKKYDQVCVICGSSENIEFDHIIPVSKGGTSEFSNIQLLCKSCNIKKSNKVA